MRLPAHTTDGRTRTTSAPREVLTRAADAVLSVLLAPRCAACQRQLDHPTRDVVCPDCWDTITRITPPICDACGDPLPSWRVVSRAQRCCPRCRRSPRAVDRGRAIGEYDGRLRHIIHAFKYGGRRSLAAPLGALVRRHGADLLDAADCAVPVPLHARRRRARGFNQAAELVAHLGLPVVEALRRIRDTPSQTQLPAGRRHRNVRDAFGVTRGSGWAPLGLAGADPRSARPSAVAGCRVVLVDDVSTTGATLEACARLLKQSGAREVRALTAARVVTRRG